MENLSIAGRTAEARPVSAEMASLGTWLGTEAPKTENTSIAVRTAEAVHPVPAAMAESIAAMASPRICVASPPELDRVLMAAVDRAFHDRGQKIDPEDMQHIVDRLGTAAMRTCPNIRTAEVPLAISDGIFGEYGEYFGLNVHTFVSFLKARYTSQKRAEAARKALPPEPEKKIPTEEELLEADKKLLARAYGIWKRTGRYQDYGNYLYRVAARKLRLLAPSEELREECLRLGKERAAAWFAARATNRPADRRAMRQNAADARSLEPGTEGRAMAYSEARQIALQRWFADMEEAGISTEDLAKGGERETQEP